MVVIGCQGKTWYTYGEIVFCRYQVLWILAYAELLETGKWPPEGKETGYINPPLSGPPQLKPEGRFVKPSEIIAEVRARLRKTGKDGIILVQSVRAGDGYGELCQEARDALSYCAGWKRKRMPYREWLKKRRWRAKTVDVH